MAGPVFNHAGVAEASCGVSYPLTRSRENGLEEALIGQLLKIKSPASHV